MPSGKRGAEQANLTGAPGFFEEHNVWHRVYIWPEEQHMKGHTGACNAQQRCVRLVGMSSGSALTCDQHVTTRCPCAHTGIHSGSACHPGHCPPIMHMMALFSGLLPQRGAYFNAAPVAMVMAFNAAVLLRHFGRCANASILDGFVEAVTSMADTWGSSALQLFIEPFLNSTVCSFHRLAWCLLITHDAGLTARWTCLIRLCL